MFRLAYTINDLKKIREQSHALHKIRTQTARTNLILEKRNLLPQSTTEKESASKKESQSNKAEEEDYVIDVYFRDQQAREEDIEKLDRSFFFFLKIPFISFLKFLFFRIKLEPFHETIQLEEEYERESFDSEDSNGL